MKTSVAAGAVGVAAGLVARTLVRERPDSNGDARHPEGWKAVTILGDDAAFTSGGYPDPLQRIAELLVIRVDKAPGDKGFEVHARLRADADTSTLTADDPQRAVRAALRDAKQLFETGENLRATPRPHGHRPTTLFGAAVDKAEDEAKGEGVL
ncbi:hypothetical protein [Subtercola sp. YIM 133946]|uniref:hypothetical protein n=1 Tax=Subtercola sp. YIM 133946 TaxID=3118909 RepID=UPI002F920C43